MTDSVVIALSTCADEDTAARIAKTLVAEGLATCVNRVSAVRSTYVWDGSLHDDAEILLIIKTAQRQLAGIEARFKDLHPYELPELVAIGATGGSERYLDWIRSGVQSKGTIR